MKYLVTGCAGFIGSHVCEKLIAQNHEVVGIDCFDDFYDRFVKEQNLIEVIDSESFQLVELDISDKNSFEQLSKVDVIIHLAGKAGVLPSLKDPRGYIDSNIIGTQNVLDFANKVGCKKIVFASSSSIYGNNKTIPFSENDNVDRPISPYAASKKACELINHTYHHLYDLDILNLRFFTVYGPRQRPDLAIHKFVKMIDNGETISLYGDGSTARDYTYIDDIVTGILAACDYALNNENVYEIVNIGNNSPVKLSELIDVIRSHSRKEVFTKHIEMQPGDVDITYADISKASSLLKYNPTTTFSEGIKKFVEWYYDKKD